MSLCDEEEFVEKVERREGEKLECVEFLFCSDVWGEARLVARTNCSKGMRVWFVVVW